MKIDVYLIRHGQIPDNLNGKICGQRDEPSTQLNETGKKQAEDVGQLMRLHHADLSLNFYTSSLGRCRETTQIFASAYTNKKYHIIERDDLREIDHGPHDGMDFKLRNEFVKQYFDRQLERLKGQLIDPLLKWKFNPMAGAETYYSVWERASKALCEIAEKEAAAGMNGVALFSHSVVINALMRIATPTEGIYPLFFEEKPLPNGAVVHFIYDSEAGDTIAEKIKFVAIEQLSQPQLVESKTH